MPSKLLAATLAATTSALSSYSPPPPKLIKQCAWQQTHCATAPQFRNVVQWYEGDAHGSGNWGVTYRRYVDGFVKAVADDLGIEEGATVFESAVGEGWFLSGLYELLDVAFDVAGNDVSMKAIEECRMELPWGSFAVGDSLNLTWVDPQRFDAVICAYVEPGENENEAAVTETWVREMCRLAKPSARVFVGNVRPPRGVTDAAAGAYLKPPEDLVTEAWWEAKAGDWGVDDVRIVPLTDATLLEEWGPRYHVFMRKRAAERKWPSWQDDMVTGGF
ncbi:unnamed protein product [Pelagomonas calceolata]|uniref:Methyltransferase domain-containing protein n=2 Tax=Pelagomonas calceolata TaxID=35677 RepID=A0A8J2SE19_9STRA|nr:unnamed protein product [Pelagomonas calceolata]